MLATSLKSEFEQLADYAQNCSYKEVIALYEVLRHTKGFTDEHRAYLGKHDRFYLLVELLGATHARHPWIYERCREVERGTDDHLDLWARGHYKSFIITYAGAIQEVLKDPEITICIFSHTGPIAKAFLAQIKYSLESETLIKLYPEILYENPKRDAQRWSLDGGLVVNRKSQSKESTLEASGLVDGQPISRHYRLRIYDDVVVEGSINTPEQIEKTTRAWELSQSLGMTRGPSRKWHIGTRYSHSDTYQELLNREALTPRIYPATDNGLIDGEPVFLAKEAWLEKLKTESSHTIACQQLQNPSAGGEQEFKDEWLRTYELRPETINVYIMCDYAGSKAAGSSNTAMAVVGIDHNLNKYILDGFCHKMSLSERWTNLKGLRNKWVRQPGVQHVKVGYERFGAQSDVEHFEAMMLIEGNAFPIEELSWPREGSASKDARIRRLEPDFRNWRFYIPYDGDMTSAQAKAVHAGDKHLLSQAIRKKNHEGKVYDLMEWFINREYLVFPNTTMKDFLDALSRIYDMEISAPILYYESMDPPEVMFD